MKSKKAKIFLAITIALAGISCSKKMKTLGSAAGGSGNKPLITPLIFCGNGLEYTFTSLSFLKDSLVVRNAVRTGRTCASPRKISTQEILLLPPYHVCINEAEYLSSQNIVGYVAGFLYAPGLTATGHTCGSIFKNGFEKP